MCVMFVCVNVYTSEACVALRNQKRESSTLELKLEAFLCILGTKPKSSTRLIHARWLNYLCTPKQTS